jgi:two-component system LytT family response regulator
MTTPKIRAIIVDDEELARRGLELRLGPHADIELVAKCVNGREAVEIVAREQPDLMFLDIQMPGLSGFDVLSTIPQDSMPIVVFVTAFDRHAIDAFEAEALDYLLKPIDEARFARALTRVREEWRQRAAVAQQEKVLQLLAHVNGSGVFDPQLLNAIPANRPSYPEIIPIRGERDTVRLQVGTIDWIDAAGDYMCVHAQGRTYVLRETMKSLETVLDPRHFQRVHRSTIVNLQRVRRMRPHTNGEYFLTLEDGQEIKLSRSYRDRVDQLLQRS